MTFKLINKLILFMTCALLYIVFADSSYNVETFIIVVIMSALISYFDFPAYRIASIVLFSFLCVPYPDFIYFVPLICHDYFIQKDQTAVLMLIIPVILELKSIPVPACILLLTCIITGYILKLETERFVELKIKHNVLTDNMRELTGSLEQKNKELTEKQDYEINLATLKERNRIAREIHDSVGHTMSSSLLQVGALIATTKDEKVQESLTGLKTTLSSGMDSIRDSVHDLHEGSVDLYTELYTLVRGFTFCPITFDYDAESKPNLKIIYSVIAIVKESTSNIIKHSTATAATLAVKEHPALYQLIITDNGGAKAAYNENGMGLKNITSRVENLKGFINIDSRNGFKIFISIPKEQ